MCVVTKCKKGVAYEKESTDNEFYHDSNIMIKFAIKDLGDHGKQEDALPCCVS
jgi:hypothetical protein